MLKKLLNKKMKLLKNQQGLTLIELLVVIVILGIIAAVAIPAVMSNREDAAYNTNKQNLAILQDAVERWAVVNGKEHPAGSFTSLATSLESSNNGGPYIDSTPTVVEAGACTGTKAVFTYSNGEVGFGGGGACIGEETE